MPGQRLTAIACSVFKPEIEALTGKNAIPKMSFRYFDSCLHMDPERLQVILRDLIEEESRAGARILVILGDCAADTAGLISGEPIVRIRGSNCGEMLLGKETHKHLVKSGAFLLFPEWLDRWREILLGFPGMDAELSRSMIRDMHNRFVYLHTGVRPVPTDALNECGAFFNLPVEVLDVGLEHFAESIRDGVARLPVPSPTEGHEYRPDAAEGEGNRKATAVMMLDVITTVLKNPGDISDTAFRLSQKLRELSGARLVIMVSLEIPPAGGPATPRVLVVNPVRHEKLMESELVRWVVDKALNVQNATLLSSPTEEQKSAMRALGIEFCPCLIIPLFSGDARVGAVLCLGLMDTSFVGAVLEIEDILTGAVSVVLNNALLQDQRRRVEENLKKSESQVRLLLNSTAEAIYGIDLKGECTFANPSCLRMLGYDNVGQLLGKNMHRLIHSAYPDGRPMAQDACRIFQAFREGRGVWVDDEVLWRSDGSSIPVEYWSYPQIEDGKVIGAVVTFIDIAKRKAAQDALALERRRLSSILEGTNIGTWEWNVQTGETVFNERWAEIVGYKLSELQPVSIETWLRLVHPDDRDVSEEVLDKHFKKIFPFYDCEVRMIHKKGMPVWVHDRGKVTSWTEDGKPLMMYGTHEDITGRKMYEERIHHLATHDALTGLPGLRLANERLSWSLGLARRNKNMAAIYFIDLDGFKTVNDTLGHTAGDFVLKAVALRMQACIREIDTLARVGGDEFLLIATSLNTVADAAEIARKLIQVVAKPILFNGNQALVGASIGISLYPNDSKEIDDLIRLADKAMYEIKSAGKNNFKFNGG